MSYEYLCAKVCKDGALYYGTVKRVESLNDCSLIVTALNRCEASRATRKEALQDALTLKATMEKTTNA